MQARCLSILALAVAFGASGQLCGLVCADALGPASRAPVALAGDAGGHAACAGGLSRPAPPELPPGCTDEGCPDCDAPKIGSAGASNFLNGALPAAVAVASILARAAQPLGSRRLDPPERVPRPRPILRTTSSLLL
jgi:hypothetical protein